MPADRLLGGGGVPGGELLTDRLVLLIGTLREGHVVEGTGNKAQLLVVKLLIAELLYAGLCFLFLFLAERTWDSCDSFVERLGMGALSVGVFGVVVGFPAYLFGADLWTGIGTLLAVAGLGLGLVIIAGLMISLVICG